MSGRIHKTINRSLLHFKRILKEKQFKILPPPPVPSHIVKPQYAIDPQNPQYAEYSGPPQILSADSVQKIKKSATIASTALSTVENFLIEQGKKDVQERVTGRITGEDIDRVVYDAIISQNAYPTPIGFMGFPKSVCLSINECIVHGIPSTRPIYLGDKLNMDVTCFYDGFHGDTNLSLVFGGNAESLTKQVSQTIEITQKALYKAISICKPGVKFSEIGKVLEQFAKENDVHICQHFTGHGVGQLLHMPPMVYHTYHPSEFFVMKPGNVFTIEPVISKYQSNTGLTMWNDGMTVISPNNPNAQFEHMILIVENGCEVLTQRVGENIPNPNQNIQNLKQY